MLKIELILFQPFSFRKTHRRNLISEFDFFLHDGNGDIIVVRFWLVPIMMSDKVADSDMLDALFGLEENHVATFKF